MPFKPEFPGERPTLGWIVLDWITANLIVPDGAADGEPLTFTREQAEFVLKLYEVDRTFDGPAIGGRTLRNGRLTRRAVLSRPKGWGKSPLVAALCLVEALGDVVMDGWDAEGRPVGRPWESLGFKPKVQIVAVSEDQTTNTWEPCLDMARRGPVSSNYDIDPMETFIAVPRGLVEAVTSSGTSREGFRPVFSAMDQTESWIPSNGGPHLASTIRRNLAKVNGCSVETPNAFKPGRKSVAERSFEAYKMQQSGRLRKDTGLLVDHREAPAQTDPTDEASLRAGLAYAYGDSADVNGGWVNLDRLVAEYWDPDTDPQDARGYYLNQVTHASDALLSRPEWKACEDLDKVVADREWITLGFDGSRGRAQGKPDATALIGCRVSDGHLFEIKVWEAADGPGQEEWTPPIPEIEAAIAQTFRRFKVAAFYADPAKDWRSFVNAWEAKYGGRVKVTVKANHPFEWWMTGGRSHINQEAIRAFAGAVRNRDLTHDAAFKLTEHVLNARKRIQHQKLAIGKEHDSSPNKVDAAVAAVLAWQARLDAVAKGIGTKTTTGYVRRAR
ncbi:hypothetical protein ABZ863_01715 [Saccharomonospora sp. NPDC046836]|uniref:hypothetical protein n=1 Tax=Saccharomonospora sp. NPDC046836 TaxID=3156921 RepID=UPI0033E41739